MSTVITGVNEATFLVPSSHLHKPPKIEYVCGFMFNKARNKVVLIKRAKLLPSFMHGKLNGVGGKMKAGEDHHIAMVREFAEEAGLPADRQPSWQKFCELDAGNGEVSRRCVVHFFRSFTDTMLVSSFNHTTEEGHVAGYHLPLVFTNPTMTNLRWLIPMALSMDDQGVNEFKVEER